MPFLCTIESEDSLAVEMVFIASRPDNVCISD